MSGAVVPIPRQVPTTPVEAQVWAQQQTEAFAAESAQSALQSTRAEIQAGLSVELPEVSLPSYDENLEYALTSLALNGPPTNLEEATNFTVGALDRVGEQLGWHPAYINSVNLLIEDFPTTPEEGLDFTVGLARNLGAQYGIMIPEDLSVKSLTMATVSAGMVSAGFPYVSAVTMSIDALWDGKLDVEEIRGMVGVVGAIIGGAVGQMFGIPAPIGAFIGSIVSTLVFDLLGKVFDFGPSASEKRRQAMRAVLAAAEAMEAQCYDMASKAWVDYNDYWNQLVGGLQAAIDQELPYLGGGLRYFGDISISEVEDPEMTRGASILGSETTFYKPLQRPIDLHCVNRLGCPYGPVSTFVRYPTPRPANLHDLPSVQPIAGGGTLGVTNAYLALAFYGAERYVTPYHALMKYHNLPGTWVATGPDYAPRRNQVTGEWEANWNATPQTDHDYLMAISHVNTRGVYKPEDLEACIAPAWAEYMFGSLVQCGPAAFFVQRDILQTVTAVAAQAEVQRLMSEAIRQERDEYEAARSVSVRAAQLRRDLIRARRNAQEQTVAINGSLLAGGLGALAGWASSRILLK
jgi:hypothetical protein